MPAPVAMFVWQQQVMLYDPSEGLYVFDNFGQLLRHIPERGFDELSPTGQDVLLVEREGRWYLWELSSGNLQLLELPAEAVGQQGIRYVDKRLYVPDSDGVAVWQLR